LDALFSLVTKSAKSEVGFISCFLFTKMTVTSSSLETAGYILPGHIEMVSVTLKVASASWTNN
jgi:hypothetical protein